MENDPAYAKRLEEILASRVEFAKLELEAGTPSDSRNNTTKRARHEAVWPPQSAVIGGSSSSTLGDDVEMRSTSSGKRSLEPGGCDDDMVCGLEVCDELDECNAYRNDCEGDYTDKMTGATLLREDVAKARAEKRYDKFEAHEEVTDETCLSRTGRKPISCRWKDINKGGNEHVEVRSRLIGREIKQNGADSYFAGTPLLARVHYVISGAPTKSKTGERRQLMVLDAKRTFLHDDALADTYVKPPHPARH